MILQSIYLDGAGLADMSQDKSHSDKAAFLQKHFKSPIGTQKILVSRKSKEGLGQLEIPESFVVVTPPEDTKGALASALLAIDMLESNIPILLIPTNSFVDPTETKLFASQMIGSGVSAAALCIESSNPNHSFVRIHKNRIIEVVEKRIVDNIATTGVFFFRNQELLLKSAQWSFINNQSTNSTFFVAPALNYIISVGLEIGFKVIDSQLYEHASWHS